MLARNRVGRHGLLLIFQGIPDRGNHLHHNVRIGFSQPPDRFRFRSFKRNDGFEVTESRDSLAVVGKKADAPVIVVAEPATGAEEIHVTIFHPLVAKSFYPRRGFAS